MKPLALGVLALALALSGCGESAEKQAAAPGENRAGDGWTNYVPLSDVSKELRTLEARTRKLDLSALADDALDREGLEQLLRESKYVIGSENEYAGRSRTFSHVVARVLVFEHAPGARAYLDWLHENASDLIGRVKSRERLALGRDGTLFTEQGCGCHSDLPTYLGAWRRGKSVLTLLADGPRLDRNRFRALARAQDREYAEFQ